MNRYAILSAALVVLLGSAIVHGLLTQRWVMSADLAQASDRLKNVPKRLGDWESEEVAMNPRALKITEATGYLSRRYRNTKTGRPIDVLVLCGRPQPIAVHDPQVCYGGIGYSPAPGYPKEFKVGQDSALNASRFFKDGPQPDPLQVLQGWTLGDTLQYPENPRSVYSGSRFLYKVYIVRHLDKLNEVEMDDDSRPFVDLFWPALRKAMNSGS